jgi:hypothetical protein
MRVSQGFKEFSNWRLLKQCFFFFGMHFFWDLNVHLHGVCRIPLLLTRLWFANFIHRPSFWLICIKETCRQAMKMHNIAG